MILISKRIIGKGIKQAIKNPRIIKIIALDYLLNRKRLKEITNNDLKTGPKIIIITISEQCNYNCIFCNRYSPYLIKNPLKKIRSSTNFMSLETYTKLLDNLNDTKQIIISGTGEPLLNQNIVEMVSYAKKKGILSCIITNGSLLTPELIKKLVNAGLNGISISLTSMTNRTYQKIHPKINKNICNKIIGSIKILSNNNIIIRTTFVLNKLNYKEVDNILKIVASGNIDIVHFLPLGTFDETEYLKIPLRDQSDLNNKLKKIERELFKKDIPNNLKSYVNYYDLNVENLRTNAKCLFPFVGAYVSEDGHVSLCCRGKYLQDGFGNINKESFEKIWFSVKCKQFRNNLNINPLCKKCSAINLKDFPFNN